MHKDNGLQSQIRKPEAVSGGTLLIYLVSDDALSANDMALQIGYFGYEVAIINRCDRLAAAVAERVPAAIVMDLAFHNGTFAGSAEIEGIRKTFGRRIPVIIISTRNNFAARLAAVNAGADGYFSKPVDVVTFGERLDGLTARNEAHSYRILIIDTDIPAADSYSAILHGSGMEARVLSKFTDVLRVLDEFRPDLVLMDAYLPNCNSVDLAKLIHQDDKYLDVPIVFLSDEDNLDKQFDAIRFGVDNYLVKPIKPAHLISALSSRTERYRALRSLIMSDSLTGLYNHSAIKEHFMREVARAQRNGAHLALAMIDIDFFKQVNDSYGHPAGDRVIRTLSRLLQQRLRRSDIVGRYGGEEFAVILPDTSALSAIDTLDKLREIFAKIPHRADGKEFTVTFSAGVVGMEQHLAADGMFKAADAALYHAKHAGRNCIKLAQPSDPPCS